MKYRIWNLTVSGTVGNTILDYEGYMKSTELLENDRMKVVHYEFTFSLSAASLQSLLMQLSTLVHLSVFFHIQKRLFSHSKEFSTTLVYSHFLYDYNFCNQYCRVLFIKLHLSQQDRSFLHTEQGKDSMENSNLKSLQTIS